MPCGRGLSVVPKICANGQRLGLLSLRSSANRAAVPGAQANRSKVAGQSGLRAPGREAIASADTCVSVTVLLQKRRPSGNPVTPWFGLGPPNQPKRAKPGIWPEAWGLHRVFPECGHAPCRNGGWGRRAGGSVSSPEFVAGVSNVARFGPKEGDPRVTKLGEVKVGTAVSCHCKIKPYSLKPI